MKPLVACRDCGYPVSTRADHCPKCFRVNPGAKGREYAMYAFGLGIMLLTGLVIALTH